VIGVAVVGAGHWGPHLIRNFHDRSTSEVRVVVDLSEHRRGEVSARYPEIITTDDLASALDLPGVDAVVVATPTSTHHRVARAALQRGKHVFVEKPLATSVSDAEQLCELAAQAGVTLMVGHVFVYNSAVRKAKEFISSSDFGGVYYIAMTRTNLGPIRTDVNAAWDLAAHDISIVNWWLDAEARSAAALGSSWINPGLEDAVFATLRYPSDVLVNLHASWLNPRKERSITVVGERKMLVVDDMNLSEPLRVYDKGVTDDRVVPGYEETFVSFRASIREGDISIPRVALAEPLKAECEHFVDCIREGKQPLTGGRDGLAVIRALEAIDRSVKNGGAEEPILR